MQLVKKFYQLPFSFFIVCGLIIVGGLTQVGINGTNLGFGFQITNIRDVNPQSNQDTTIHLQGKVTAIVPLLEQKVYQLQDSTGKIWVLTEQTNLQISDQVMIKGTIRYESIPLAGQEFGEVYIYEQQQLERIPVE